jgi:GT2 family glycosyltransferase
VHTPANTSEISAPPRFLGPDGRADVAVVVVTYHNAADLDRLVASLRAEAMQTRLRVVVVDNASTDGSLAVARAHEDVVALDSGGNLGYAGGINAAMSAVGDADAVLVLNPDLVVEPGCIAAMRARLATSGAGVVVPMILDADGDLYRSLRREPSLLGALGDAAFGARLAARPGRLAEMIHDPAAYQRARTIDWATGAALLVDRDVAREVGPWDERFFLYSEETDFLRRVREAGHTVWFEPAAVVRHAQGGSGASLDLDRLLAVNRIRYFRKHHGPAAAALFRALVVLHELVRVPSAHHRAVLHTVVSPSSWSRLPHADVSPGRSGGTPS